MLEGTAALNRVGVARGTLVAPVERQHPVEVAPGAAKVLSAAARREAAAPGTRAVATVALRRVEAVHGAAKAATARPHQRERVPETRQPQNDAPPPGPPRPPPT